MNMIKHNCVKQIGFIDDKYINLVSVYWKHIQFISTITEILPISFLFHLCITGKYASH